MLVAHPNGELRRRAAEGLDLLPLAPDHELDLKAGWKLSRALSRLKPDIVHAHDPHGVAMASVALSMLTSTPAPPLVVSRRVDFRLKRNSFSRWKYRQVNLFIASSDAIRDLLVQDGVAAGQVVTVHEGIDVDRMAGIDAANVHEAFWLPHGAPVVGNVAALVRHKGQRHLVDAMPLVIREVPDARLVILGEGELRPQLEHQVKHLHLDKHVVLPGFPRRRPGPHQRLRHVRDELGNRGARHLAARRDGRRKGMHRHACGRDSRSDRRRRDRVTRASTRPTGAGRRHRAAVEERRSQNADGRGWTRAGQGAASVWSEMVEGTLAAYASVANRAD